MTKELYSRLACALLHDIKVCSECKKCGNTGVETRMNLIKELAKATGKKAPFKEEEKE